MDKPTLNDLNDIPSRSDIKAVWPDLKSGRSSPIIAGGHIPHYREHVQSIASMMGLPLRMQMPKHTGYPTFLERMAVARDRVNDYLSYHIADTYLRLDAHPAVEDVYLLPRAPFTPCVNALHYLKRLHRLDDFIAMGRRSRTSGNFPVPVGPRIIPKWPRSSFAPQYLRCEWKRYMNSPEWLTRPYQAYAYFDSLTPMTVPQPVEAMRLNRKIRGAQDVGYRGRRENPIVGWPYWLEADVDKDIDRWANRR
jgi:hypothetical protein